MSCPDTLKDSEIFNEINHSSGDEDGSESESLKDYNASRRKKALPDKKYIKNKRTQVKELRSGSKTGSSKSRKIKEIQHNEGKIEETILEQVNLTKETIQDKHPNGGPVHCENQEVCAKSSISDENSSSFRKNYTGSADESSSDQNSSSIERTVKARRITKKNILSRIFNSKISNSKETGYQKHYLKTKKVNPSAKTLLAIHNKNSIHDGLKSSPSSNVIEDILKNRHRIRGRVVQVNRSWKRGCDSDKIREYTHKPSPRKTIRSNSRNISSNHIKCNVRRLSIKQTSDVVRSNTDKMCSDSQESDNFVEDRESSELKEPYCDGNLNSGDDNKCQISFNKSKHKYIVSISSDDEIETRDYTNYTSLGLRKSNQSNYSISSKQTKCNGERFSSKHNSNVVESNAYRISTNPKKELYHEGDWTISDSNKDKILSNNSKHKFSLSSSSGGVSETNEENSVGKSVNPRHQSSTESSTEKSYKTKLPMSYLFKERAKLGGDKVVCNKMNEVSSKVLTDSAFDCSSAERANRHSRYLNKYNVSKNPSHSRFLSSASSGNGYEPIKDDNSKISGSSHVLNISSSKLKAASPNSVHKEDLYNEIREISQITLDSHAKINQEKEYLRDGSKCSLNCCFFEDILKKRSSGKVIQSNGTWKRVFFPDKMKEYTNQYSHSSLSKTKCSNYSIYSKHTNCSVKRFSSKDKANVLVDNAVHVFTNPQKADVQDEERIETNELYCKGNFNSGDGNKCQISYNKSKDNSPPSSSSDDENKTSEGYSVRESLNLSHKFTAEKNNIVEPSNLSPLFEERAKIDGEEVLCGKINEASSKLLTDLGTNSSSAKNDNHYSSYLNIHKVPRNPLRTWFLSSSSSGSESELIRDDKIEFSNELKANTSILNPISNTDAKLFSSKNKDLHRRSIRKRRAKEDESGATPSKISYDSLRSNSEVETKKTSTSKKVVGSEDKFLPDDVYHPRNIHSPSKSVAKKNLFSPIKNCCVKVTNITPTKQKADDHQNDKENRDQSSNSYEDELSPQKITVCRPDQNLHQYNEIESPVKNQLTPLKQVQTPTKQKKVGSSSKFERGTRTPRKNIGDDVALKGLEKSQILNELSPMKNHLDVLSPRKKVTRRTSKTNSDGEPNECDSRTRSPQKESKSCIAELKRLNIDCNPSFYEALSPRKSRSSVLKSTTPQKHKDIVENTLRTPQKGSSKENGEVNESDETDCSTSCKNEFKLLSGVKGTPAVKRDMHKQNMMSPLQRQCKNVTTPVSKKKCGKGFLTPSMATKECVKKDQTYDDLDTTRNQLHISTVPKSLPCRDAEFGLIKSFLLRKIEHFAGGCMYISGVPGTGKTATVHAVIRSLQQEADSGNLQHFDFVEVNGLRLTEPKQAYVRILQTLTNKKLSPDQAQQLLNKRFLGDCKKPTIILVDELDYLCNRRQDVVYNILDWPSKRGSALVVLTISNTMDLPERTLKGRVTSRMGLTRVTFQPYTHHQLKTIVEDRLSGTDTFHPDAVQLVARKVAAVSGDARRALDICRRTTELVTQGEQVTVSHVERALTQIFSGPRVAVIQSLCREGQLVLRAIRDVNQRTGVDEAMATQVYQHLLEICLVDGCCSRPTVGDMLQTCVALVALGLIVAEKGRMDITRKISLNVSSDDIHYALDKVKSFT